MTTRPPEQGWRMAKFNRMGVVTSVVAALSVALWGPPPSLADLGPPAKAPSVAKRYCAKYAVKHDRRGNPVARCVKYKTGVSAPQSSGSTKSHGAARGAGGRPAVQPAEKSPAPVALTTDETPASDGMSLAVILALSIGGVIVIGALVLVLRHVFRGRLAHARHRVH
jgi:hypothetical protein